MYRASAKPVESEELLPPIDAKISPPSRGLMLEYTEVQVTEPNVSFKEEPREAAKP